MTLDPISDVSSPFNAKYDGACQLDTCMRHRVIEQGDVCQFVLGALMHMSCARRVVRNQAAPLCEKCWLYHAGGCP